MRDFIAGFLGVWYGMVCLFCVVGFAAWRKLIPESGPSIEFVAGVAAGLTSLLCLVAYLSRYLKSAGG